MNRVNTQTFIINEEDNDYDHDCNNYNGNNKIMCGKIDRLKSNRLFQKSRGDITGTAFSCIS